jgi:ADP-ribosylation factor-like protein 2
MKQKSKRSGTWASIYRGANRMQGLQLNAVKTHKWHIIRCSAVTGANLQEGLAWVVQDAKARLFLY